MPAPTRATGGRWATLTSTAVRKRIALTLSPALAFLGLLLAPALPAEAAVSCNYSNNGSITVTVPVNGGTDTLFGEEFAGHYSGNTVVPSSTRVTSAGEEAQCLLKRAGYDPGGIDGVFGSHSQAAARAFQSDMNTIFGAGLSVDGGVGPHTWPWLRWWSQ
jgi:hypothetical protein